jgi:hypothetical protein
MTAPFESVANRLPEFGSALKAKLAYLAEVPEKLLYLTDLRSGSIIAELLVLPSTVAGHPLGVGSTPEQIIERLRGAVAKGGAADLCSLPKAIETLYGNKHLTGDALEFMLEGCTVEIKDLGHAEPLLTDVLLAPQQKPQLMTEDEAAGFDAEIIYFTAGIAAIVLMSVVAAAYIYRSRKSKKAVPLQVQEAPKNAAKFNSLVVVEAQKPDEEKPEEKKTVDDDNTSTLCPSDTQSENAFKLATVKALSNQDL